MLQVTVTENRIQEGIDSLTNQKERTRMLPLARNSGYSCVDDLMSKQNEKRSKQTTLCIAYSLEAYQIPIYFI